MILPKAREKDLVVQELEDETLVYDLQSHQAYALNRTAGLVWRHCNGQTNVEQMTHMLQRELNAPIERDTVWFALKRLDTLRLLKESLSLPLWVKTFTRRQALKTMGKVGLAALIPTVITVVAPQAAQAATCVTDCTGIPFGTPCDPPNCTRICCGPSAPKKPNECVNNANSC